MNYGGVLESEREREAERTSRDVGQREESYERGMKRKKDTMGDVT